MSADVIVVKATTGQISITTPSTYYSGTLSYRASIYTDDAGGEADRVEFFHNGRLMKTDTTKPFSYIPYLNYYGCHEIVVKAYRDGEQAYFSWDSCKIWRHYYMQIKEPTSDYDTDLSYIPKIRVTNDYGWIISIELYVNGDLISTKSTYSSGAQFYNVPLDFESNTITARGYDRNGGQIDRSFTVYRYGQVNILTPTAGSHTTDNSITVITDNADGLASKVEFYLDNVLVATDYNVENNQFSRVLSYTKYGYHYVAVIAYDSAGNPLSFGSTFFYYDVSGGPILIPK